MTLKELFEFYKTGMVSDEKIILCNYKTQDGFEIKDIQSFQNTIDHFGDKNIYLLNNQEINDFTYFDYFEMEKVEPYIVVFRHPELTNSYFKDAPDKILGIHNNALGMWHYLMVDYGDMIKDFVIEAPPAIEDTIWKLLKKRFPESFKKNEIIGNSSFSFVFTNSDRFKSIEQFSFKMYDIGKIFPDIKSRYIEVASRRIWKEILKIG